MNLSEVKAMEEKKKKKYVKPVVIKLSLDAKTAVLGGCKMSGSAGPNGDDCGAFLTCHSAGS